MNADRKGVYSPCLLTVACLILAGGGTNTEGLHKRSSFKLRSSSLADVQRVFVCNAFVDERPIMVASDKGSHGSELAYKQCEHYEVAIQGGTSLLLQPAEADEAIDALDFKDAPTAGGSGDVKKTCVAVIHRQGKRSPKGVVQWLCVPQNDKKSEIATVDAYALAGDDIARGLAAAGIPGINTAAVFRMEDRMNPELELSRQVISSRTLSLGRVYSASPGSYHLVLEDLMGSNMVGYEDIDLAKGGQYIMMRVGEPGSKEFPEQLIFRALVDQHDPPKKSRSQAGPILTLGMLLPLVAIFAFCS